MNAFTIFSEERLSGESDRQFLARNYILECFAADLREYLDEELPAEGLVNDELYHSSFCWYLWHGK